MNFILQAKVLLPLPWQNQQQLFQLEPQRRTESISSSSNIKFQIVSDNSSIGHHSPLHSHVHNQIQQLCNGGRLEAALSILSRLDVPPPWDIYLLILRACNRRKDRYLAKFVLSHLNQYCAHIPPLLADHLVVTLATCGAFEEAQNLFQRLHQRSVFSWTAMISAFTDYGQGAKVLSMYEAMLQDGIEPDRHAFMSLIKACSSTCDLHQGHFLHSEARLRGLTKDICVCNSLINMYGKCGSIVEAEDLFSFMPVRNQASWTSMISSYVVVEQHRKALLLYRQMLHENEMPNDFTFAIVLQACYGLSSNPLLKLMCLEIGRALHSDVRRSGSGLNMFVGTMLINLYGRCGKMEEAEHVFFSLSYRDAVVWNTMLTSYVEQDQGESALHFYMLMQLQGVKPDPRTFVILLQACFILTEKEKSYFVDGKTNKYMVAMETLKAIHRDAKQKGFTPNVFFGTTLLGLYAKYGMRMEAEGTFEELCRHDVVTWTAMITAYVDLGQGGMALKCYREMYKQRVEPNEHTYVMVIQACSILSDELDVTCISEIGRALHADIKRRGYDLNVFIGTALLGMYAVCGTIEEAENVFLRIPQHDLVSWNAMLYAYVEQNYGQKALLLYNKMLEDGVKPNEKTFGIALQACGTINDKLMPLGFISALHDDILKSCFVSDTFLNNTLLTMYGRFGALSRSKEVFDELSDHDVISWNAMLTVYLDNSEGEKALELYFDMHDKGITANDVTLMCVLQACSITGSLQTCQDVHFSIISSGYDMSPSLTATLIHAYGSCGSMADAHAVFNSQTSPDIISWNAYISSHAGVGNYYGTMKLLQEMLMAGIDPDRITLASFLSVCSRTGLVNEGLSSLETMCKVFGINLDSGHYSSIVDLVGRAGNLELLESVLSKIPGETDPSIWLSFLGACYVHGNVDLGKQAFEYVVGMEAEDATAYVLMSNLCAYF